MIARQAADECLQLDEIQGNVVRAYGRFSFPCARYFFLNIRNVAQGRAFIEAIRTEVTTAQRWTAAGAPGLDKPLVTLNIGFTFRGLLRLGLPTRTLQNMPEEYIDGMRKRAHILGDSDSALLDKDQDHVQHWDRLWRESHQDDDAFDSEDDVHIWISMNAQVKEAGSHEPHPALEDKTKYLKQLCAASAGGVAILAKNGPAGDEEYQSATAIFKPGPEGKLWPSPTEHFGFADGIGDPVFKGQYRAKDEAEAVIGRGKWMDAKQGWQPLATGEFILGYPDESQELPPTAAPANFMNNGTFMVYRKLHENVETFEAVIAEEAAAYAQVMQVDLAEAKVTLKAKMVGRWPDGVPLSKVPDYPAWRQFRQAKGFDQLGEIDPARATPEQLKALAQAAQNYKTYFKSNEIKDFRYGDDLKGYKCPVGSHLRRTNTRDYMDPLNTKDGQNATATTQLNKRRRILRRGLPYGPAVAGQPMTDQTEQGVIFMAICTSLFRQFEFVQQQWIQYGLDFNAGNNTCPVLGNHAHHQRYTINADPASGKPPYIMSKLKTFVETRGGDYFFIPSMTALRMIGMGIVDPT